MSGRLALACAPQPGLMCESAISPESALHLRESASIHCHLRLTNSLFLTADTGR